MVHYTQMIIILVAGKRTGTVNMTTQEPADLVQQVAELNYAIVKWLNTNLKSYGVTATNYFYVMKIGDHPGIVQNQLNTIIKVNPSTVTRAINHLIEDGFIIKEADPDDHRATRLRLSQMGETRASQITTVLDRLNGYLLDSAGQSLPPYDQILNLRHALAGID